MRKRDLALIVGFMACFTGALGTMSLWQIQTQRRSEVNVGSICDRLEKLDGKPCSLVQPSDAEMRMFTFLRWR